MTLEGAVDLHVHAAPSLFPRWGDAVEVAEAAHEAGMRAVLLKAHEGSTVGAAALAGRAATPVEVHGGVVLNHSVGGINPAAVDACLRMGGRSVWFPTIDSAAHARAYGRTGGYRELPGGTMPGPPVPVLDGRAELRPEALEVLAVARDHGALVATGHLGWDEVALLLRAAADLGHDRMLVQHPLFRVPGLDPARVDEAIALGAHLELTALAVAPRWRDATIAQCLRLLARAPIDRMVVSSDGGQRTSPPPPKMLASFLDELAQAGAEESTLDRATRETPARLLGVSTNVATEDVETRHDSKAGRR